jgi:hypothetical protein
MLVKINSFFKPATPPPTPQTTSTKMTKHCQPTMLMSFGDFHFLFPGEIVANMDLQ